MVRLKVSSAVLIFQVSCLLRESASRIKAIHVLCCDETNHGLNVRKSLGVCSWGVKGLGHGMVQNCGRGRHRS